jgi:hypothetical protein
MSVGGDRAASAQVIAVLQAVALYTEPAGLAGVDGLAPGIGDRVTQSVAELAQQRGLQAVVAGVAVRGVPAVGNRVGKGLPGGSGGAAGGEGGSRAGLADVGVAADIGAVALRAYVVD